MKMTGEQKALFEALRTDLQRRFVTLRVANPTWSLRRVYREAGGNAVSDATVGSSAHELRNNRNVAAFLDSMALTDIDDAIMSRNEMLLHLSDMARTQLTDVFDIYDGEELIHVETGEIIKDKRLILKPIEEMGNAGLSGITEIVTTGKSVKFKMNTPSDKRAAMKQLAELEGYDAPVKHEVKGTMSLSDFYNAQGSGVDDGS